MFKFVIFLMFFFESLKLKILMFLVICLGWIDFVKVIIFFCIS